MSREHADPGYWFSEAAAIARSNFALTGTAFVVMMAIGVTGDLAPKTASVMNLLLLPVQLLFQYEVTLAALAKCGLVDRQGRRRLWALLGLGILSGLGIALGAVLLILPGLYLYVRWSLATPILIAEGAGPIEAMTRSGEEVSGRFWQIAALFLLVGLPWAAGTAADVLLTSLTLLSSLLANSLVYVSIIMAWCAAVAVYCGDRKDQRLEEVFA